MPKASDPAKAARPAARRRRKQTGDGAPLALALASLAHEIRTPLNSVLAFSELLCGAKLPPRAQGWAQAAHAAAQHLERLTTSVVDGMRAERNGLILREEEFSPRQLARDMAAALRARAAVAGLPVEIAVARGLPARAQGDGVRLRAALENLLDNAVKFANGGDVAFAAQASALPQGRIRLDFTVSDQGRGVPEAARARLFRPFAQADAAAARRGGAGLGLFFARAVARAMGGELTLDSPAGGAGSTFRLRAEVRGVMRGKPAAGAAAPAAGTRRKAARAVAGETRGGSPSATATRQQARSFYRFHEKAKPSGRALDILCAEDNGHGQAALQAMLSALGHRATCVGDGAAAIAALRARPADLILLDVTMPRLDGFETARRLRAGTAATARIPIIGLSAHDDRSHRRAAKAAGMDAYLTKPVTPRGLAAAIAAALRRPATPAGRSR